MSTRAPKSAGPAARALVGALSVGLFAALCWAVLSLPRQAPGLSGPVAHRLPDSGVTNPVTAVLLNYRGYDTLLELAVLLLAVAGVWSICRGDWPRGDLSGRPLLTSLMRMVLPVMVLTAGYLLWVGAFAPGGAFQGGAVLGGGFVLALLCGLGSGARRHARTLRAGLALGVLVFAAAAGGAAALSGEILRYPPGYAGPWILAIEAAALLSIGLTLGALYVGGRPPAGDQHA